MNSETQPVESQPHEQPDAQCVGSFSSSQQSSQPKRKRRHGPHRGPSRALKYKKLRHSQPEKLEVELPAELGATVGKRALQFVGECGAWVKEFCPLNVVKWDDMPEQVLNQLYGKIREKYELPAGDHVQKALKYQCSSMYRHWRERLKKKYFTGKSLKTAERSCPPDVDPIQWRWLVYCHWDSDKQKKKSETNRLNAISKKIQSACGAKSSARILREMEAEIPETQLGVPPGTQLNTEPSSSSSSGAQPNDEPIYIKFWNRVKRRKDGKLDDEAELKLQKLQQLHERQIREKGVDNLTIEEAFLEVLGYRSGYARGLGKGHPVLSKKRKNSQVEMQPAEEQLRDRESELWAEIERLRADARRKEEEAREREAKREEEARQREAKLRADLEVEMQLKFENFMTRFEARMSTSHGIALPESNTPSL